MKISLRFLLMGFVLFPLLFTGFGLAQVRPQALAGASGRDPAQTQTLPEQPVPEGPVVARVYFTGKAALAGLAASLDIWEVHQAGGFLVALLTPSDVSNLLGAGVRVELDADRTRLLSLPRRLLPGQTTGIPGFPCYRTVEETYAAMAGLAASRPDLARWIDIGDSWDKLTPGGPPGYDLFTLVLTNQARPVPKPRFFLMAAIHAREYTTAETAARFAEHLVNGYGSDPDITWLLDNYEVHIVPVANPDGRKWAEQGVLWRKNTDNDDGCTVFPRYGTDLNRNHSFHWGEGGASNNPCGETFRGPAAAAEPEVQALQYYLTGLFPDQRGPGDDDPAPLDTPGILLTLHSYSQLVLWPYGFRSQPAPNNAQLRTLGRKLAYFNGYTPQPAFDLYPASGTTDDWSYGELGIASYTFEMGKDFFESCSAFESTVYPQNLPALLYSFKSARRPYLNPAGPDSLDLSIPEEPVKAGKKVKLAATAYDNRYLGGEAIQAIAEARFTIDAPAWITGTETYSMTASDGAFDETVEAVEAVLDTTGLHPGRHIIFIESRDAAGNWGVPSAGFLWVEEQPGEFDFTLSPGEASSVGLPGETITYTLQLTNTGQLTDQFDFRVNSRSWPATISPDHLELIPGTSAPVLVAVSIPPSSKGGESDRLTLLARSKGNPARQVEVSLLTRVWQRLFLPLVE